MVRLFLLRRHSQVVRQRTANPLSPVRIRVPPPLQPFWRSPVFLGSSRIAARQIMERPPTGGLIRQPADCRFEIETGKEKSFIPR